MHLEPPKCWGVGTVSDRRRWRWESCQFRRDSLKVTQLRVREGGQGLLPKSAVGEWDSHAPRRIKYTPAPVETLGLKFVFRHLIRPLQLRVVPPR